MKEAEIFKVVKTLWYVIPMITTIILYALLSKKTRRLYSIVSSILSGWVVAILFTVYIYNPTGTAAGYESGIHFPESIYDNNTISVVLIAGWFYPMLALAGFLFLIKIKKRIVYGN